MNDASLLETTAEVAVAFAGFIGIILVLAARDGRYPARDSLQIRVIVVSGVAPVFYAVLPLILYSLASSGEALWRISSAITGIAVVSITLLIVRQIRVIPYGERPSHASPSSLVGWTLTLAAMLCLFSNALSWPWPASGGLYLLAVWLILAVAGTSFVELIFRRVI